MILLNPLYSSNGIQMWLAAAVTPVKYKHDVWEVNITENSEINEQNKG